MTIISLPNMILLKPHVTEKAYAGITEGKKEASTYVFKLIRKMDKDAIAKLIEKEFKVTVTDVRTINLPGKSRRFKGIVGRTSPVRKALVRLKVGDRIAAFDVEDKAAKPEKE